MECLKIDTLLFPVKIHYFLFMTAIGCAVPFRTIFAKQLGISATAVGVIFLTIPFFKILTNPLLGLLMDHFKKFRVIISILMMVVAVTHGAMLFITPLETSENLKKYAENLRTVVEYVCPLHENRTYIKMNNQFQTESDDNVPHVSCEVTCEKTSREIFELTEEYESCDKNISGIFWVNFKISNYSFEFSLASERYVAFRDSTRKLLSHKGRKLQSWQQHLKTDCSKNQICFTNTGQNWSREISNEFNQTNNHPELYSTFNQKSNINLSIEINNAKQYDTFIEEKLYLIKSSENHSDCLCKQRLNCSTTKCSNINDQENPITANEDEFLSYQFWSLFFLVTISSTSFGAVFFLIDTMCYEMLSDRKENFGLQRLWGAAGYGVGGLTGGFVNQLISGNSAHINYSLSIGLLGALIIIDLIPVYKFQIADVKYSSNICKDVCSLFLKIDIVINIITVFTIGVLSGMIWNYQLWFLEEIGASQVLMGLSLTFECIVAEVPCYFISGWVIRKIGYANCNSLTFLCFGIRYLCFALMWDPWMSLPVGLLHGPTYGIFHASMTMYGKTEAPPGTEATVQSLLAVSFDGIGLGTGCLLGGIGFDKLGSRNTFLISSIISFALLVVYIFLYVFVLRKRTQKPSEK